MLMPHELSPESQKKYFDKIIETDLNPMQREGLRVGDGQRVVVKVFDQVGRFIVHARISMSSHHTTTPTDSGLEREGKIPRPNCRHGVHGMFALQGPLS